MPSVTNGRVMLTVRYLFKFHFSSISATVFRSVWATPKYIRWTMMILQRKRTQQAGTISGLSRPQPKSRIASLSQVDP